ncbi:MAG: hypothetical protein A2087_12950 [Spirochaetes bacterium GWD1_61_31]|nr:MAG: hypothetical protein A2Y37_05585 [Spirochaetes bacterium GWB1_60_80]OHD34389.1 MAG: hypothetical protein A2004_06940 [Spirochaetes bacterium GWC1_61_12]OHD35623.1 MAG: hypothetical protein A2087_12950 [Spirochaetes bacterium GWD1_61_31]OHD41661.1 MAG: hypothetical protein A2Y35_08965 [Spirochaetes bacterium GWE1_60_18]OHD61678.1 MAG: hypothetical protein A2Y32_03045 [Spirochaetes bacterium GWF1_60_12]HAP42903.1 hypothetical protein [Spirochaetaceae bacterium]
MFGKAEAAIERNNPASRRLQLYLTLACLTLAGLALNACRPKSAAPVDQSALAINQPATSTGQPAAELPPAPDAAAERPSPLNAGLLPPATNEQPLAEAPLTPPLQAGENRAAVVTMQNTPRPSGASPTATQPGNAAPNLAGADYHLLQRPFDTQLAHDYLIGPLFANRPANSALADFLHTIQASLVERRLPLEQVAAPVQLVTRLMYEASLAAAEPLNQVRIGQPTVQPDGSWLVYLRLVGAASRSRGLLVISQANDEWRIDHLSLDEPALSAPYLPLENFDPYGVLQ